MVAAITKDNKSNNNKYNTLVEQRAKDVYSSDDAQTFYKHIWGDETIHIGRYDLLSHDNNNEQKTLTTEQQILRAQEIQEENFVDIIASKFDQKQRGNRDGNGNDHVVTTNKTKPKLDILDMGCGYGGLLRRLWKAGYVHEATGVDIAAPCCTQARALNEALGCDEAITIFEESYLHVPQLPDCSVDLVISMEALLHVGPSGQPKAIQEAFRVLRPGGWMIFTDILQKDTDGENSREMMQPIYNRLDLDNGLGTVASYTSAFEAAGFVNVSYTDHSSNVAAHYGSVLEVLLRVGDTIGLSQEFQIKMQDGLQAWRDLAPKHMAWGFFFAQKCP